MDKIGLHLKVRDLFILNNLCSLNFGQFLVTLNFYARGTYQRGVGDVAYACMSQTMVSRSIAEISEIISDHLMDRYIFFPENVAQMNAIKDRYFCNSFWFGSLMFYHDLCFKIYGHDRIPQRNWDDWWDTHCLNCCPKGSGKWICQPQGFSFHQYADCEYFYLY